MLTTSANLIDIISKFEEEKEKLFVRYEQLSKLRQLICLYEYRKPLSDFNNFIFYKIYEYFREEGKSYDIWTRKSLQS